MRKTILKELEKVIELLTNRTLSAQSRDDKVMKVRTGYARALAQVVNAYSALKRDTDLDELNERLEALEAENENE